MASIFDYDSAFMRGLEWLVDVICINVLLLVTSIPIVTVGASLTAAYDALRRLRDGEGHIARCYFRAFRANFVQSTLLWLVYGAIGFVLAYMWLGLRISDLLLPNIAFGTLWIVGFEWVWYLQSRFANTVGVTLCNSLLLGLSYLLTSVCLIAIDAIAIYAVYASVMYMPQGLFLLGVLGPGFIMSIHLPILERRMAPMIKAGEAEARKVREESDGEDDRDDPDDAAGADGAESVSGADSADGADAEADAAS